PLKYLKQLVDESVSNGVQFYENTAAIDVEYNKHPTIITRDGYRVTCRYVIEASHYPFYDGQGFYPTRLKPERSYIIGIKTDESHLVSMYINRESSKRSIRSIHKDDEHLWLIAIEYQRTGKGTSTLDHYVALQNFAEKQFGVKDFIFRWTAEDLTNLDK